MKFGTASAAKLATVHPDLRALCNAVAAYTNVPPDTDWGIVQGSRTQAQQNALYAQGRSRPGRIVTYTKNSRHIGGYAIDYALWKGKWDWSDLKSYAAIGARFKKIAAQMGVQIVWGGDWKNKDWGHIELDAKKYPKGSKATFARPIPIPPTPLSIPTPTPTATPKPTPPVILPSTATDRPMKAVLILMSLGWTFTQACGMVGNLQQESYADLRSEVVGDSGHSHGIGQWNDNPKAGDRFGALLAFAAKEGKQWTDFDTQVKFVDHETRTTEWRAWQAFLDATTIEKAVDAGILFFRPSTPHRDKRVKYAQDLCNRLKSANIG